MRYTLNRVDLIGNLGRDPDVRTFPNGGRVTSLLWRVHHDGRFAP
jgi:single-stranded DNA-binding protein